MALPAPLTGAGPPPAAVVLMCHGGWPRGRMQVRWWYPPVQQNRLLARALERRLAGVGVVTVQVRNRVRGWNEPELPAVEDARRAAAEVRRRWPDVRLVLLGYSMGARTAARLAAEVPAVGLVALAPWWPEDEPGLVGTPTVVVHGARDLVTPPRLSHRMALYLAAHGTPVRRQVLAGCGHLMLRRRRTWQRLATEAVLHLLPGPGKVVGDDG
ncbi:alpha/beta fold hydrolase [Auraticoccus sp. F435]|uniref:Alpha/beta fold hydrolase n=1 Tax=Auraticoccus cholistanensis TaxID=2656650 RepID=A0A6A9US32_9ACTN|nr:alpha/beta hydrolase [Auraticoccus cholistanensis]MVA75398.1 alpha/beta fold hydrolase [Auraticoccus cholistanensis]